ncbi:MAG TPA: hypothetical protein VHF26_26150 [Trebonia sp.]|nr:hypothetical protein [Trebonia sp.]
MIVVVLARLGPLVISWWAELSRQRARTHGLTALLGAARTGVFVMEKDADGSVVVMATAADRTGRDGLAGL